MSEIIKFADASLRIKHSLRTCEHKHFDIDPTNRIVTCRDCGKEVDAFEAVMSLLHSAQRFHAWRKAKISFLRELTRKRRLLNATKTMNRLWKSRLHYPACPKCLTPITPENVDDLRLVPKDPNRRAQRAALPNLRTFDDDQR